MRPPLVLLGAFALIAGSQGVRELAKAERDQAGFEEPFAPSPGAAPFVALGYRELMADLLFFRLVGYFGGDERTAEGVAGIVEAIVATDPSYEKVYAWGAQAMVATKRGLSNDIALRAIAILEAGAARFPRNYKIPVLAGQIYAFNLQTKDEAQRRAWNEKAAAHLEAAIRKPNAPAGLATFIAHTRDKLGQRELAVQGLREMILITDDEGARAQLLAKLAELEAQDADEIAAELFEARKRFERAWRRERPSVPATMYILVGGVEKPGFDLATLALGGRRELLSADTFERLPPLTD